MTRRIIRRGKFDRRSFGENLGNTTLQVKSTKAKLNLSIGLKEVTAGDSTIPFSLNT
jgi:hypothetical protein